MTSEIRKAAIAASAGILLSASGWVMAEGEELPEARQLVQTYIDRMGGRELLASQSASLMSGNFEMPGAGIGGPVTIASRSSNERVTVIELEGLGEIRSGYSPDLAWSVDPFMGARLIEGEERAALADQSELGGLLREESHVETLETVELTEMGGQRCFRVRIQWKSGRESHDCYSEDSGLVVAMEMTQPSPMGEISSVTLIEEYQEMNGQKVPVRTRIQSMGQEQIMTIESLEIGAPDDEWFELPAAIQALKEDQDSAG